MSTPSKNVIGLADLQVVQGKGVYECPDIGSGIAIIALDAELGVAGFAHLLFPSAFGEQSEHKHERFVNTGVTDLVNALKAKGCDPANLTVAYVGASHVLGFGKNAQPNSDVGVKNSTAVESALNAFGITPKAVDVGGTGGRTLTLDMSKGIAKVRTFLSGETVLFDLTATAEEAA